MRSRAVARAARRFADQQSDRFADQPTGSFFATVTAVDGPSITVRWRGKTITGRYRASYTPAAGDWSECHLVDNQLVVKDRIAD